ncbi:MAG: hypothetical protein WCX17_02460 [Parcubacteria group bacterium]
MKRFTLEIVIAAILGILFSLFLLFVLNLKDVNIGQMINDLFNSNQEERQITPYNPKSPVREI